MGNWVSEFSGRDRDCGGERRENGGKREGGERESGTEGVVGGAGVVVITRYYGLEKDISTWLLKLWGGIREKERANVCKLNCPPTLFSARVLKSLLFVAE